MISVTEPPIERTSACGLSAYAERSLDMIAVPIAMNAVSTAIDPLDFAQL
jgi:hypothetical protein